ncbi:MAG TPA: glycosyltransferase [Candidatus Saccharimonadales bacterium]|nr:glycosyltransferase [Candidatus Saccharimonadales bacterium]
MKIGIFTDTYHPSINGVVSVVDILRHNFTLLGHEVFVFAPGEGLRIEQTADVHVYKFPTFKGGLFNDLNTPLFFPPMLLNDIKKLDLDVIHFLTPGQVGLMGLYAAHELKIPVVSEYCTDLFEYVEHYPFALPVLITALLLLPLAIPMTKDQLFELYRSSRPRLGIGKWNKSLIRDLMTILHSSCNTVIVHSKKSARQLASWQKDEFNYRTYLIPTGVDPLPKANQTERDEFCKKYKISPTDEVVIYVGRLSQEKNLDLLIDMMPDLIKKRPNAKLIFVGDFDYRETLERNAKKSNNARIIFTGRMPREKLGIPLSIAKVFAFPSLSDTQGLVLHEAALAGVPIVMCDPLVSEVVKNGENGFYCKNNAKDMANKIAAILNDDKLQKSMSAKGKIIAGRLSEKAQAKKIIDLYKKIS